jgi:hypothetical protein
VTAPSFAEVDAGFGVAISAAGRSVRASAAPWLNRAAASAAGGLAHRRLDAAMIRPWSRRRARRLPSTARSDQEHRPGGADGSLPYSSPPSSAARVSATYGPHAWTDAWVGRMSWTHELGRMSWTPGAGRHGRALRLARSGVSNALLTTLDEWQLHSGCGQPPGRARPRPTGLCDGARVRAGGVGGDGGV